MYVFEETVQDTNVNDILVVLDYQDYNLCMDNEKLKSLKKARIS